MRGIDEEDALFIEAALRGARVGTPITVDRSRLDASHEAWVHMTIGSDGDCWSLISGFGPYTVEAALTWPNSDWKRGHLNAYLRSHIAAKCTRLGSLDRGHLNAMGSLYRGHLNALFQCLQV